MFKYELETQAPGRVATKFVGPGLFRHANEVVFNQPDSWPGAVKFQSDRIQVLLMQAYEAGKRARSAEILQLLGGR